MKKFIKFLRRNALFAAMLLGITLYEVFAHVECLIPVGETIAPVFPTVLPFGLFAILYFTFCKIKVSELRPRTWHFAIQATRVAISATMVGLIILFQDKPDIKLILEGMFICFICPTASAVVVVAEKLGGSVGSLTIFTMIANVVTMIIIPTFFPMVEREANITFAMAALMLLRNVVVVLLLPLVLAFLSRRFIPKFVQKANQLKNLGFYIWCFNLTVVTGITMQNIAHSTVSGYVLWLLLIAPLFVCLIQFALGKAIGRHWNDSISAGQALGQKNTVVGIWLTLTFLNPLAAISPGAYVLWQNLVNGLQIWYKEKYGKVWG